MSNSELGDDLVKILSINFSISKILSNRIEERESIRSIRPEKVSCPVTN